MLVPTYTLQSNDLEGRIAAALAAMRAGIPVILLDDFDRENEADLIVAAEKLSVETMALMIRECSGIVCLCLSDEKVRALELPPMAPENGSRYGTPFTVSIEARHGVTTGVSAADRVSTIQAAIARNAQPLDLVLLEQEFDALGQLADAVVLGLVHLGQVQLGLHLDADLGELAVGGVPQLRGVQQGLGRHAADVQAGAAQGLAHFDAGDLQAQLTGADRGVVAARAAPDDDDVVGSFGHGVL